MKIFKSQIGNIEITNSIHSILCLLSTKHPVLQRSAFVGSSINRGSIIDAALNHSKLNGDHSGAFVIVLVEALSFCLTDNSCSNIHIFKFREALSVFMNNILPNTILPTLVAHVSPFHFQE
jgi:hypothetical protein